MKKIFFSLLTVALMSGFSASAEKGKKRCCKKNAKTECSKKEKCSKTPTCDRKDCAGMPGCGSK